MANFSALLFIMTIAASSVWCEVLNFVYPLSNFRCPPPEGHPVTKFTFKNWTTENGLPQNSARCLLQARDGYLWIGTLRGVARFDGAQFEIINQATYPEFPNDRCNALAEGNDGAIWVGTSGGLVRIHEGKLTIWRTQDGLSNDYVRALSITPDGTIWIATNGGLNQWRNGRLSIRGSRAVDCLYQSRDGTLWIGSAGLQKRQPSDNDQADQATKLQLLEGEIQRCVIHSMAEGPDGTMWFGGEMPGVGTVLFRWSEGSLERITPAAETPVHPIRALAVDAHNQLWMGHGAGLFTRNANLSQRPGERNELENVSIECLLIDRQGNLWIGTGDLGLFELPVRMLQTVPEFTWARAANTWTVVAAPDGSLWTGGNFLNHYSDDVKYYQFLSSEFKPTDYGVRALFKDHNEDLWAGLDSGHLLRLQNPVGRDYQKVEIFDLHNTIKAICRTRSGDLWVGTGLGAWLFGGTNFVCFRTTEGLSNDDIAGIFGDRGGALWFGTYGGGINRYSNGSFTAFTMEEGLPSNVAAVAAEDENGSLWIITDRGLCRMHRGQFRTLTTANGLTDNILTALLDDDLGNYWFNSYRGIFRVSKRELNEAANGKISKVRSIHYGLADGAHSLEANCAGVPNSCRTADGKLCFPTTGGVVIVDPKRLVSVEQPPEAFIEEVRADDATLFRNSILAAPRPGDNYPAITQSPRQRRGNGLSLEIPPGKALALTFRFSAIDLNRPEGVEFKYRLNGHDLDWIDAEGQRFAVYSGLRPGHYVFEVRAANAHGAWSDRMASMALHLQPFFYQTLPFYVACGILIFGIVAGLQGYRLRVQRRFHRLEQEAALARERERIARDLHDDLGASLSRIALLSQVARRELGAAPAAVAHIEKISIISGEVVDVLGEVVWAANPKYDNLQSMAAYFRSYAAEYLNTVGIHLRFSTADALPSIAVSGEFRRESFLILKEALHNVAKHAKATKVELSLRLEPDQLVLVISDNVSAVAENHPPRVEITGLKITHLERLKSLDCRIGRWIDFGDAKLSQDGVDQCDFSAAEAGMVEATHRAGVEYRPPDRAALSPRGTKITRHFDLRRLRPFGGVAGGKSPAFDRRGFTIGN